LNKGADINKHDYKKKTPLHLAVSLGDIEMVKLLLNRGANREAKQLEGYTPRSLSEIVIRKFETHVTSLKDEGCSPGSLEDYQRIKDLLMV
jgi:hypothetical protein